MFVTVGTVLERCRFTGHGDTVAPECLTKKSTMNLSITDAARARILKIAETEGVDLDASFLRFAVIPGGCSGLTYDLGWDTTVANDDETSVVNGLRVVLDAKTLLYMDGTELDFSDGLEGKGFHFLNPQAERTCACGESFGL